MSPEKARAVALLTEYDTLRIRMRDIERELGKACADYGRSMGVWGFSRDHLRLQLERETKEEKQHAHQG